MDNEVVDLGSLRQGDVFHEPGGAGLWVVFKPESAGVVECGKVGATPGYRSLLRSTEEVVRMRLEEVAALLGRVLELEKENAEMALLVHDKREEMSVWIEHGAQMERTALLRAVKERTEPWVERAIDLLAEEVKKRGPVLPQLPPDRLLEEVRLLWAENEALRAEIEREQERRPG